MTGGADLETRKVVVDGVPTSYIDAGDGEPLVSVHGIPTSSKLFAPLVKHLQGVRLIAPDLPGQGGTVVPSRGKLDHAAYSRHLAAFLSQVPPESFHLLVHDFGGVIGLPWCAEHLDRVRTLTVLSTIAAPEWRWSAAVRMLYATNLILGSPFIAAAMPRTVRVRRPAQKALFQEWAAPWTRRRVLQGRDHFGEAHLRRVRAILPRLALPVLVIWGENDTVFPIASGRRLASRVPSARFEQIANCGHWSPLDAPEAVAGLVREHMLGAGHARSESP